jgi:DNA-binding MarR family transcriptional regulator
MASDRQKRNAAPAAGEDLATDRLRLWLQMLKAVRSVEQHLRERLRAEYATTLPRFDVLATLHAAPGGLRMSELSRMLNVSNGNVTGVVERLVSEGFLRREQVEGDRRASRVRLTERGTEAVEAMIAAHRGWIDEILGEVGGAEAIEGIATMLAVRRGAARGG